MQNTFLVGTLDKKYVYYLTFILNPNERNKSTILSKTDDYEEFEGIFDDLPTELTTGQEFVNNVFKCDDIKLSDLRDLLEDHFKEDIDDFFELLDSRDLEIGDLFLHDNYWLSSPDCVGKECFEHSIDNLNSGKYFCEVYEKCNGDDCLKYLKIDLRNSIKKKAAQDRIDLYKSITSTNDDVNSFIELTRNCGILSELDDDKKEQVLAILYNGFSSKKTVEDIVEETFYKDGKNYNCECDSDSDSDSDSDDASDIFSKSKTKHFKDMNGGSKKSKGKSKGNNKFLHHHDYDEAYIRKIEDSLIKKIKDVTHIGLTTKDILKSHTTNWKDEVFRGGNKQSGGGNSPVVVLKKNKVTDRKGNIVMGDKWSVYLYPKIDDKKSLRNNGLDPLIEYGKTWKFYTGEETQPANLLIDDVVKEKIKIYNDSSQSKPFGSIPSMGSFGSIPSMGSFGSIPSMVSQLNELAEQQDKINKPVENKPVELPLYGGDPPAALQEPAPPALQEPAPPALQEPAPAPTAALQEPVPPAPPAATLYLKIVTYTEVIEEGKRLKQIITESKAENPKFKDIDLDLKLTTNDIEIKKGDIMDDIMLNDLKKRMGATTVGQMALNKLKEAHALKEKAEKKWMAMMELAISDTMPVTTTFAEKIWFSVVITIQKTIRNNVGKWLSDERREEYKEWLSLSKDSDVSDTWGEWASTGVKKVGRAINKGQPFTEDGRKAIWARGAVMTSGLITFTQTLLLLIVKNPQMLSAILYFLVKAKQRMCNSIKISRNNIKVISKPKTIEEELEEVIKGLNRWAVAFLPPFMNNVKAAFIFIEGGFLMINSCIQAVTVGFCPSFKPIITWIFGILVLTSEDIAKEAVETKMLFENVKDIVELFDWIGCFTKPYILNISPNVFNSKNVIQFWDTGIFRDYSLEYLLTNDSLREIISPHYNNARTPNDDLYFPNGTINRSVGLLKYERHDWATDAKGNMTWLFDANELIDKTAPDLGNGILLKFKGEFNLESFNINYLNGMKTIDDIKNNTFIVTSDAHDIKIEFNEKGELNKFFAKPKKEVGYILKERIEAKETDNDWREINLNSGKIWGSLDVPSTINNFERLIMEMAATNPLTCTKDSPTIKFDQIQLAGLKYPVAYYENINNRLFENKSNYGVELKTDGKFYIKFMDNVSGNNFDWTYNLAKVVTSGSNKTPKTHSNYLRGTYDFAANKMSQLLSKGETDTALKTALFSDNPYLTTKTYAENDPEYKTQTEMRETIIASEKTGEELEGTVPMCEDYLLICCDVKSTLLSVLNDKLKKEKIGLIEAPSGDDPTKRFENYGQKMEWRSHKRAGGDTGIKTGVFGGMSNVEARDASSDIIYGIVFKTKSNATITNSWSSEWKGAELEVTEILYINFQKRIVKLSHINKHLVDAFSELPPETKSLPVELHSIFNFFEYDAHSARGEKYKLKGTDCCSVTEDEKTTYNALRMYLSNVILLEKSDRKIAAKYYKQVKQANDEAERLRNMGSIEYLKTIVYPKAKELTKNIIDFATEAKNKVANFAQNKFDSLQESIEDAVLDTVTSDDILMVRTEIDEYLKKLTSLKDELNLLEIASSHSHPKSERYKYEFANLKGMELFSKYNSDNDPGKEWIASDDAAEQVDHKNTFIAERILREKFNITLWDDLNFTADREEDKNVIVLSRATPRIAGLKLEIQTILDKIKSIKTGMQLQPETAKPVGERSIGGKNTRRFYGIMAKRPPNNQTRRFVDKKI